MTLKEATEQLKELRDHCADMARDGDNLWSEDVQALTIAIYLLEQKTEDDEAEHTKKLTKEQVELLTQNNIDLTEEVNNQMQELLEVTIDSMKAIQAFVMTGRTKDIIENMIAKYSVEPEEQWLKEKNEQEDKQ